MLLPILVLLGMREVDEGERRNERDASKKSEAKRANGMGINEREPDRTILIGVSRIFTKSEGKVSCVTGRGTRTRRYATHPSLLLQNLEPEFPLFLQPLYHLVSHLPPYLSFNVHVYLFNHSDHHLLHRSTSHQQVRQPIEKEGHETLARESPKHRRRGRHRAEFEDDLKIVALGVGGVKRKGRGVGRTRPNRRFEQDERAFAKD